jgi:ribosomal-protein-alanine N-acetyltransferase
MSRVRLLPIDRSGAVDPCAGLLPPAIEQNCAGTAAFYEVVGFEPPWIGYVCIAGERAAGNAAFKGAPREGRVEIAYFTLPELEGKGIATATAAELVRIAREARPGVLVAAQTLPAAGASTRVLQKMGFTHRGSVMHPEDGEVWEWQLAP